jgi:hypothetical protein
VYVYARIGGKELGGHLMLVASVCAAATRLCTVRHPSPTATHVGNQPALMPRSHTQSHHHAHKPSAPNPAKAPSQIKYAPENQRTNSNQGPPLACAAPSPAPSPPRHRRRPPRRNRRPTPACSAPRACPLGCLSCWEGRECVCANQYTSPKGCNGAVAGGRGGSSTSYSTAASSLPSTFTSTVCLTH